MRAIVSMICALVSIMTATATYAIKPPKIVELTDGTTSVYNVEWSPDGQKLAILAADGVLLFEVKAAPLLTRKVNIQAKNIKWLSSNHLIGIVMEKMEGERFRQLVKTYKIGIDGSAVLVCESSTSSPLVPFQTSKGRVWYDSAGVVTTVQHLPTMARGIIIPEYKLANHYPQRWSGGRPEFDDEFVWLVTIDGSVSKLLNNKDKFWNVRFSGNGEIVVGHTTKREVVAMDFEGHELCRIASLPKSTVDPYSPWVSDPDLSPDGEKLLFVRGWDDDEKQETHRSSIYLRDLPSGEEMEILTPGCRLVSNPRFNASGDRAAFVGDGKSYLLIFDSQLK